MGVRAVDLMAAQFPIELRADLVSLYESRQYNEDQPRDADGRFGSGGGDDGSNTTSDGKGYAGCDDETKAAIDLWTSDHGSEKISGAQRDLITKAVYEHGDTTIYPSYRGIALSPEDRDQLVENMTNGGPFVLPASSFSYVHDETGRYYMTNNGKSTSGVLIQTSGSYRSLDVTESSLKNGYNESERIVAGSFRVTGSNGITAKGNSQSSYDVATKTVNSGVPAAGQKGFVSVTIKQNS